MPRFTLTKAVLLALGALRTTAAPTGDIETRQTGTAYVYYCQNAGFGSPCLVFNLVLNQCRKDATRLVLAAWAKRRLLLTDPSR